MARCVAAVAVIAALVAAASGAGADARTAARCTKTGTARDDTLRGTSRRDVLCGLGGSDTLDGLGGNDILLGGSGNDVIRPGAGRDTVSAGRGSDLVFSVDRTRDSIDGGPDADRGRVDSGRDRVRGVEELFPAATGPDPVLLAAGDIADCTRFGARVTAPLLEAYPAARVAALGDVVYPKGEAANFRRCYTPTWGRAKARTRPAVGNHEYETRGAIDYYAYWGSAAGERGRGYYSYDIGSWHVVVLNTECAEVPGGCGPGSPQEQWLRADLAARPSVCTLAYWHRPTFSSGKNGSSPETLPLFTALYEANADLLLVGHDHNYERFAPQSPSGAADPTRGIREIVVGTGGAGLSTFATVLPNSEVRDSATYGVLKLTLKASGYDWQFIPEAGKTFRDSGSGACH